MSGNADQLDSTDLPENSTDLPDSDPDSDCKKKPQVFQPGEAPEMPDVQVDINPLREQVSLPDTVKRNTGLDGKHFNEMIPEKRERKQTDFFHDSKPAHYMSCLLYTSPSPRD